MAEEQDGVKIKFHYLKSSYYRVIHVDGAIGGVTPTGEVFFSLYSQRPPIPDLTVQLVSESGQLVEEIKEERQGRDGVVREVEAGLVMSLPVASQLRDWLTQRIDILEKALHNEQQPERNNVSQVKEK